MHIDYDIQRMNVKTDTETTQLSRQWEEASAISQQEQLGETARSRLAFNMVDYITSEDLPLRLLITRAPQAIAKLADERKVYKEPKAINGRKGGVVYSKQPLVTPKEINYTSSYLATRIVDGTAKTLSSDNLIECLKAGDVVTPLDGILLLNCKRIAIDIARLKKQNPELNIVMKRIEVSDSLTNTTRKMASYQLG